MGKVKTQAKGIWNRKLAYKVILMEQSGKRLDIQNKSQQQIKEEIYIVLEMGNWESKLGIPLAAFFSSSTPGLSSTCHASWLVSPFYPPTKKLEFLALTLNQKCVNTDSAFSAYYFLPPP